MRAFFVHNPAAGPYNLEPEIAETIRYLQSENVEIVAVKATMGQGDATTYAREAAAQHCDLFFLCGGDGTIAQAAEGLVNSETALAILPGGTGNVFARQLNLPVAGPLHPKPLLESARLLLSGQVCPVDVGRVTLGRGLQRHFMLWAGVGFDAKISRTIESEKALKKRLGPFAFAITGFMILRDAAGTSVRLHIDGQQVNRRLLMLVANNIQIYGIIFRMAPHAVIDDGSLDVYGFAGNSPAKTALHAIRLLVTRHIDDPDVDIYRVQRLEITGNRPMPVQIDGDYVGETPATIECIPRALRLVVPPNAPATLFRARAGISETRETPIGWMQRMARDVQNAIRPERY